MIYLDTHVVLWLCEGLLQRFSRRARKLIEENNLLISPIVKLELQYLYEIERSTRTSQSIVGELQSQVGLSVCDYSFDAVVSKATELGWTRDPFDRLIVANALCRDKLLLTKDVDIRRHTKLAVWN